MVATNGILIKGPTSPSILFHAPVGVATDSYDFDGNSAKIYQIRISAFRTASTSHYVYLTIPGFGTVSLLDVGGQTVANPLIDGEIIQAQINPCLTVPAGAVIYWNHAAGFYNFLMTFELKN